MLVDNATSIRRSNSSTHTLKKHGHSPSLPIVTAKMQIHSRNPELKNRIDAIDSDQLEDDDLMRVPLTRFIELMRIKKHF